MRGRIDAATKNILSAIENEFYSVEKKSKVKGIWILFELHCNK
jgi:hypothetical protein